MREVQQTIDLAKQAAGLAPVPDRGGADGLEYEAWEAFMLRAARGIAATVDHDADLLRAAIGPPIEVGRNPAWRVLLSCALLAAEQVTPAARPHLVAVG